ncbi:hypothetical protein F4561_003999 [Lipingzhangella halophila]|uniref:Uncharacterized protein n=1 Tax=Lipingzhangella halophila TaxID=1783352 RepID=A0A7W7W4U5_9ACTN|nr:hypothetical protein [Lipingzhangella halophila]MBB4933179.1 hypothetical protein [Lipingzhangella halophila]
MAGGLRALRRERTATLIPRIALLNLFNRINVTVRERAGAPSWKQNGECSGTTVAAAS